MSLYAEYIMERLGDHIVENEKGFATFRFPDEKTVYIVDIYVKPDFRNQRVAVDLADFIMETAKKRGCTKMLGSVVPSAKGSTSSVKVLLGYGMKLDSAGNDFVLFSKEIA